MNDDVKIIVLRVNRGENKPNADTDLFGRTLEQWVCAAMRGMETESADYREGDDLLSVIVPHLSDVRPITVVLYSDTPLVTYSAVNEAITRFRQGNDPVLRLTRGWIFRTSYARGATNLSADRIVATGNDDFVTVFNYNQLAYASDILRSRITYFFMDHGVEIVDPSSTFIGVNVVIEPGVKIYPNCTLRGKSIVRTGAVLKEGCVIDSSIVECGAVIENSTLKGALVCRRATVGPYAHLRSGTVVDVGAKIGDYVEIKNSKIGAGSKVCHLAYVGDAEVGAGCNIGAGVVFANYNGSEKRRITLGEKVFVGSNSTLVAPLEIGKGAFIAAGSVITESVPADSLAVGRGRQVVKEHWGKNTFTQSQDKKEN